ncbi:MAG: hypothetical protein KDK70_16925 [Myxococcales bacterium]|nr:hypothetical protein [Myxococcales bacterium]
MGLAILRYQGQHGDVQRFELGLGSNAYYEYQIGAEATTSARSSMRLLASPSHRSGLVEAPTARARVVPLDVPAQLFSARSRFIQLRTYRTRDRQGPAVSDIVAVLPSRRRALSLPMSSPGESMNNADTIPFTFREVEPLSDAQGLVDLAKGALGALGGGGGLADIAKQIAARVGPQLLDYMVKGAATLGGGAVDPAALQLAQEFLGFLAQRRGGGTSTAPRLATPMVPSTTTTSTKGKLSRSKALQLRPVPPPTDLVGAMALPAVATLTTLLPSLLPMIERVMTPETTQMLLNAVNPTKMLGTLTEGIGNGLKALNRAQLEMDQRTMNHLSELMRPTSDTVELKMLEGMSVEQAVGGDGLDYRRVGSVQLDFDAIRTITVAGQPLVAYLHGRELAFPFSVQTPRPIRGAGLQLELKDAHTRALVLRRRMRLDRVQAGRSARIPRISAAEAAGLRPGGDYLATLTLVWSNASGRRIGTSRTQLMRVLDGPTLGEVTPEGPAIPLSDPGRHRLFWHKIWEGELGGPVRRLSLDCRYYYALEPERRRPARTTTVARLRDDPGLGRQGQLQSGMVLDLHALDELATALPGGGALDAQTRELLRGEAIREVMGRRGRRTLELEGEQGQRAAVWVYPEVARCRVTLQRPGSVNENGLVTAMHETTARFPAPTRVHFVGARED